MASKRFLEVHKLTAEFEGGWSNHKADPGGKTMYGVTERVYHAWLRKKGLKIKPVRGISLAEAKEIYYQEYWLAAGCHKLKRGVDRMVYDAAVNSGVGRSRKWLLSSIGSNDDAVTVRKLYNVRLSFLKRLKTWPTFGRGWKRRVDAMQKTALDEAGTVVEKPKAKTPVNLPPEAVEEALRQDGSRTIENADKIKPTLWTRLQAFGGPIAAFFAWVADMEPWVVVAIVAMSFALIVYLLERNGDLAENIIGARVDDARTGQHIGRAEALEIVSVQE